MNSILQILKENEKLVTDNCGFSRKIKQSGYGVETYQIHRELFNSPGTIEIIDLSKGEKNA